MTNARFTTGTDTDRLKIRLHSLVMEVIRRILEHRILEGFLAQNDTSVVLPATERVVAVLMVEKPLMTECLKGIVTSSIALGDKVFAEINAVLALEWNNMQYKGKKRILAREIADVIMWRLEGNEMIGTTLLQAITRPGFQRR